jgi:hypothetical protein
VSAKETAASTRPLNAHDVFDVKRVVVNLTIKET